VTEIKYKAHDRVGQLKLSIALQLVPHLPPIPHQDYRLIVVDSLWAFSLRETAEGVTRELGGRADNGLRPYPSLIKVAFMGGQIG